MFTVPGFRSLVSAPAHQKFQSAERKRPGTHQVRPPNGDADAAVVRGPETDKQSNNNKPGKKRKRDTFPEVTGANLDALWKNVVEKKARHGYSGGDVGDSYDGSSCRNNAIGKPAEQQDQFQRGQKDHGKGKKKPKYKEKKVNQDGWKAPSADAALADRSRASESKPEPLLDGDRAVSHKKTKGSSQKKRDQAAEDSKERSERSELTLSKTDTSPHKNQRDLAPALPAGLTPLQQKMRQKLASARFRHLNQMLYTTPSAESLRLFGEQPEMFEDYHAGFRQQVEAWPENPVDVFISRIKARGRLRDTGHRRDKRKGSDPNPYPNAVKVEEGPAALPRGKDGFSTIADLGCGDATIARAIAEMKPRPKIRINSYDLHAPNEFVTVADIANLPLRNASVDVAIFCLALMGTNWPQMVEEAARIVRMGGEVWVAEIKSRFARGKGDQGAGSEVNDAKGEKKGKKGKKSFTAKDYDGTRPEDAFVEEQVEGDSRPSEGEGSFVAALARRGLKLRSRDGSNKMFVLMEFEKFGFKSTQPTAQPNVHGRVSMKFVDPTDSKEDERGILKPCVYKLR